MKDIFQYYQEVKTKFIQGDLFNPVLVHLLITNKCNFQCRHCFAAKSFNNIPENKDLTLEEYDRITKTMGRIGMLMVCGGEPFLKSDLVEILKMFVERNQVARIGISTNGYLANQILPKMERLLAENDIPFQICFSVDGPREVHDFIRKKGSYDQLMKTWELVKQLQTKYHNLSVDLSSVVNKYNHDRLDEMYDIFDREMDADHIGVLYIRQEQIDKSVHDDIDLENYRAYCEKVAERVFKRGRTCSQLGALFRAAQILMYRIIYETLTSGTYQIPCTAGKTSIVFDNIGRVYACEVRKPIHSLREVDYDFQKIFYSKAMDYERSNIVNCKFFPCTHETENLGPSILFSLPPERENELYQLFQRLFISAPESVVNE